MREIAGWRPARRIRSGVGKGLRIGRSQASADYASGTNELPVQLALRDLLRPGDVFVDIGANVGFFSLLASRMVENSGQVYALEPVPANVREIRANLRRNRLANVEVIEVAASDAVGSATLTLTRHPGGAALASAGSPPDPAGQLQVETATLDALVEQGRIRPPSTVKIDVEGAEEAVLAGMTSTMASARPLLVVEIDGSDDHALARRRLAIVELLQSAGYDVEELENSYPTMAWRVAHLVGHPRSVR